MKHILMSFFQSFASHTALLIKISEQVQLQNQKIDFLTRKISEMQANLDALTAAVAKDATVEQSAITLLNGLKQALDAAIASQPQDDGAALDALSAQLGSNSDALAAAVTANTPAAPATPAQPAQ
jgi:hypothetical protein